MAGISEYKTRALANGGEFSKGGSHASCTGKRTVAAATYPLILCRAIIRGIWEHLKADGILHVDGTGQMADREEVDKMAARRGTQEELDHTPTRETHSQGNS